MNNQLCASASLRETIMEHTMRKVPVVLLLVFIGFGLAGAGLKLEKNQVVDNSIWPGYSLEELILYRNSLFAQYGYIFKSSALYEHFMSLGWYKPNKNFTFSMLSKIDQQNVNAILEAEKQKVTELKRGLEGATYGAPRYFLAMKETGRVPGQTRKEMTEFWKKSLSPSLAKQIRVPEFLSAAMTGEKDRAYIDSQARAGARFTWWEGSFDGTGVLRKLRGCSRNGGGSPECNDTCYFDVDGRLVLLSGNMVGTVNYEYYYQYCLGRLVWIELTIIDGAAGSTDKAAKFFM
jgi:hypothetical protein